MSRFFAKLLSGTGGVGHKMQETRLGGRNLGYVQIPTLLPNY